MALSNKERISNWFRIDGIAFDVIVLSIKESAEVLYSDKTGRTIAVGAPMTLAPLGTFFNYQVTVKRNGENVADYDTLVDYVTQPTSSGFYIHIVHNNTTWDFKAYISKVERELQRIDDNNNVVYWKEMTLNIIAMEAQVTPT